jgi:RES domain-containing protein
LTVVWRLCAREHAKRAFRGEGARRWGGRWNPPGYAAVYCAGSLALACLEILVHVDPEELPAELVAIPAEIPETVKLSRVEVSGLPADWQKYPAPLSLQKIGRNWIQALESPVLRAPSAVIPVEDNYLLNPLHPEFSFIVIGRPQPFSLDRRLRHLRA